MKVTYESKDGIGFITLDRPDKLNALNDDMARGLQQAVYDFDDDESAPVAVLSGAGRAFCAGADVVEKQLRPREELVRFGGPSACGAHIQTALLNVTNWKPVVAAVHGYVLGSGLRLAMHCELIVAAESTRFQITETSRGLDAGTYWMLIADRSPWAFASYVALTGRFWSAQEALDAHLVSRVVPDGEQLRHAVALAQAIAANPPRSIRAVVRNRRAELAIREQQTKWRAIPRCTSRPSSGRARSRSRSGAPPTRRPPPAETARSRSNTPVHQPVDEPDDACAHDLGDDEGMKQAAAFAHQAQDVMGRQPGRDRVDPDRDLTAGERLAAEKCGDALPGRALPRLRHGVLEIEEDPVGTELRGLQDQAIVAGRHRDARSVSHP